MNEEIKALKHYLTRYYRAAQNRYILADRLNAVRINLKDESLAAEIEARLKTQDAEAAAAMKEVMETAALLPENSEERIILELRHIDCRTWVSIQRTVHLTANPCYRYYRRGLETLLQNPGIRVKLGLATSDSRVR